MSIEIHGFFGWLIAFVLIMPAIALFLGTLVGAEALCRRFLRYHRFARPYRRLKQRLREIRA